MLIRLVDVERLEALEQIEKQTPGDDARVLYVTPCADTAKALARCKMPCIFTDSRADGGTEDVFGVDMVVCGTDTDWRSDEEFLNSIWERHYGLPRTAAKTARLLIRESVMSDLPYFQAMYEEEKGNPDVRPLSDDPGEELSSYIRCRYPFFGYGLWSVVETASGRVIGRAGLEECEILKQDMPRETGAALELSYLIARGSRGRGYGREAASAVLEFAREKLGESQVLLRTSASNHASKRLAASLGFRKENNFPDLYKIDLTSDSITCMM